MRGAESCANLASGFKDADPALKIRADAPMHAPMASPRRHRGDRPLWTALLAALVLLVQGLSPAGAMAHASGGQVLIEICTHEGAKTIAVDTEQAPPTAMDCCDHCVMATALAAPASGSTIPVRFAMAQRAVLGAAVTPSARSRAPPRPPSIGPPLNV